MASILWGAGGLLLAGAAWAIGLALHVGWRLTHPARRQLDESPSDYGLAYSEIEFASRTPGLRLQGWFLPAEPVQARMTVIFSHGYAGTRLEKGLPALALAHSLVQAGYNVLMFDFRNCGVSAGTLTTIGCEEQQDLLGAIDWAAERCPGRIALLGFSMGGATALLAAARERRVAGVVADSSFSQLKPYLQRNLSVWSKLPRFPFTPLIISLLPRLVGVDMGKADALAAVDLVYPRPILFIHSQDDPAIPVAHSEAMWQKHPDRFQLWKTAGAGHVGSYKRQPLEYTSRVLAFFAKL